MRKIFTLILVFSWAILMSAGFSCAKDSPALKATEPPSGTRYFQIIPPAGWLMEPNEHGGVDLFKDFGGVDDNALITVGVEELKVDVTLDKFWSMTKPGLVEYNEEIFMDKDETINGTVWKVLGFTKMKLYPNVRYFTIKGGRVYSVYFNCRSNRYDELVPVLGQLMKSMTLTPLGRMSDAMSKDLNERRFKFVGTTICYTFMQAVGMVNDHVVGCYRYKG